MIATGFNGRFTLIDTLHTMRDVFRDGKQIDVTLMKLEHKGFGERPRLWVFLWEWMRVNEHQQVCWDLYALRLPPSPRVSFHSKSWFAALFRRRDPSPSITPLNKLHFASLCDYDAAADVSPTVAVLSFPKSMLSLELLLSLCFYFANVPVTLLRLSNVK